MRGVVGGSGKGVIISGAKAVQPIESLSAGASGWDFKFLSRKSTCLGGQVQHDNNNSQVYASRCATAGPWIF